MNDSTRGLAMSFAARTVFIFGTYLVVSGIALTLVPETVGQTLNMPGEPYLVRIIGLLMLCFAFLYIQAARYELRPLFGWTVLLHAGMCVAFVVLVAADLAPTPLLSFCVAELIGALATGWALRAPYRGAAPIPLR